MQAEDDERASKQAEARYEKERQDQESRERWPGLRTSLHQFWNTTFLLQTGVLMEEVHFPYM